MTVRLSEVLDAMADYGDLLVSPTVEKQKGAVTLTLTVTGSARQCNNEGDVARAQFETLGLYDELRYVVDLAQMRALAERFDIAPEQLEPLLPKRKEER